MNRIAETDGGRDVATSPIVIQADTMPTLDQEVQLKVDRKGLSDEDWAILGVGGVGIGVIILAGGKVATNALLLSVMSVGSAVILWIKMPPTLGSVGWIQKLVRKSRLKDSTKEKLLAFRWKDWLREHELLMDLLASCGVLFLFGTTLTGLLAAGLTALAISAILRLDKVVRRGKALVHG
jgi:hypothetical protein